MPTVIRASASPSSAVEFLRTYLDADISNVLPTIRVPTDLLAHLPFAHDATLLLPQLVHAVILRELLRRVVHAPFLVVHHVPPPSSDRLPATGRARRSAVWAATWKPVLLVARCPVEVCAPARSCGIEVAAHHGRRTTTIITTSMAARQSPARGGHSAVRQWHPEARQRPSHPSALVIHWTAASTHRQGPPRPLPTCCRCLRADALALASTQSSAGRAVVVRLLAAEEETQPMHPSSPVPLVIRVEGLRPARRFAVFVFCRRLRTRALGCVRASLPPCLCRPTSRHPLFGSSRASRAPVQPF
jgi:hypothetical protein